MAQLDIVKSLNMSTMDSTNFFWIGSDWELSITGTWTGEIAVLRRFSPTDTWGVTLTTEENIEDSNVFKTSAPAYWLVVVKVMGTGTANVRCVR